MCLTGPLRSVLAERTLPFFEGAAVVGAETVAVDAVDALRDGAALALPTSFFHFLTRSFAASDTSLEA